MNRLKAYILSLCCIPTILGCSNPDSSDINSDGRNDVVIQKNIINSNYIGNGVQWGGYEALVSWTGNENLSSADWQKLFERVEFMRPPIVRLMISAGSTYLENGEFRPDKNQILFTILDFCQEHNIQVIFGEWGHSGGKNIDAVWLEHAANFAKYLVETKNYSCIKYYNMVNEPNGDWSSMDGNYDLWKGLIQDFYAKLESLNLHQKIELIGPDIAIWDTNLTWWMENTRKDLDDELGAYDIHTYPTETIVRIGQYQQMIAAYKNSASSSKPILMGELGFKYNSESNLGKENKKRIAKDKYSSTDSNMFIYDSFYGVDIADAIIQNMLAGYSGTILWDMDDAMYNNPADGHEKLKRWGFWNILGSEKFENPEDENIRPWFYTSSLLCRYFPQGSQIFEVTLPNKQGVRGIAGTKNGKYTIALVNSHMADYEVYLKMEQGLQLKGVSLYKYIANDGKAFEGCVDAKGLALPASSNIICDLSDEKGYKINLPKQSFVLLTNMP